MPRYAVGPGVLSRDLGDETVLLDTDPGGYFQLNRTGAFVWSRLTSPMSAEEVAVELAAATKVELEVARGDVSELAGVLESRGLVTGSE